jgi:signal transduction histidine kinase
MSALEHYSSEVVDLFGLACRFECDRPVLIYDETAANHLFRIAQEAVNNAIKHGRGKNIVIRLWADGDDVSLSITDDGVGLPQNVRNSTGMGLHIMNYRAKMIGATLEVQACSNHGKKGTVVTCTLQPVSGESNAR